MKKAYYFSHDANARNDPKITKMISEYGMEGYGWYWVIIEILREQANYRLSIDDQSYAKVIAFQTHGDPKKIKKFIDDCVKDFKLFKKNKKYLWSVSLLKRMKIMEKKRENGRKAALKRHYGECQNDAKTIAKECQDVAIKEKKKKENNEISDYQKLDWRN